VPRSGDGVYLTLVIESVDELYSSLAPRLCPDGVFIETESPEPVGSEVGFRVMLDDGVVLIQGRGTVLWNRLPNSMEGPSGMAVQFDSIDGDTRETVDAVIDAHLSTGGELFDLDGRGVGDVYPTDALDQQPGLAGGGARWVLDDDLNALGSVSAAGPLPGTRDVEREVVDLKFEEAISGFTEGEGSTGGGEATPVDRAISEAVVAPATDPDVVDEPAAGGSPAAFSSDRDTAEIPEILDEWRQELEVAAGHRDPPSVAGREGREPTEWESLLPFDAEGAPEAGLDPNATRPVEPISSARRMQPAPRRWSGLWLIAPAAVIVLIGLVLVLGRDGEGPVAEEPEPVSEPEAAVAVPDPAPRQAERATEPSTRQEASIAPTAVAAAPAGRARTVRAVEWSVAEGVSEVVIRGDGVFAPGQVDAIRLGEPPRVLVRVRGITRPYRPNRLDVDSPELVAVRVGYHPELKPPTLYVVLDLTTAEIDSAGALRTDGDVARIRVRSGGP
jgi:Tfp pilus assembly protein PilZ